MLELEVIPEMGLLGESLELVLGMHFSHVVAIIQSLVGTVKGVQILYSDFSPLTNEIVINLTQDGVRLVFDPINQRLKIIEVFDLTLLRLRYCDDLFNCPEVSPTTEKIEQTFGATHPGVYDDKRMLFSMTFRGLCFEFSTSKTASSVHDRLDSLETVKDETVNPSSEETEFLRVSRMYIYCGNNKSEVVAPKSPNPRYPCVHQIGVEILRKRNTTLGIRLLLEVTPNVLYKSGNEISVDVYFGDSVQDVLSAVGAPSRIFFKSEDKMKIHLPNASRKAAAKEMSDYFYNYFTLGIDILFDARTNCVKKFVLHTNYPGHYNFNIYHRCQFSILLHADSHTKGGLELANQPAVHITAFSRWTDVSDKIMTSERPVVLNRANSTNSSNPFGSTFCYGYQDIIFEVMSNNHLASVTIYSMRTREKRNNYLTNISLLRSCENVIEECSIKQSDKINQLH